MAIEKIPLTDMVPSETGTVVEINGGRGIRNRLHMLGIRPGKKVTKVSITFSRGPVVLQVGGSQVSLGHGVSYKIIVEVDR